MTAKERQLEMDELATSLSETLALHFPPGSPVNDEKLVKRWLGELMEATAPDMDTANTIMRLAVEKWKAIEPGTDPELPKPTATSFSLLDQLSAMPKRVLFDDIERASTPLERLELLQQVDHVDDVASDWKKVLEMLLEGLTKGDYINEYIQIHAKWFNQCGSSLEYTSIQFGLCSNLVKALRHFFATRSFVSNNEALQLTKQQELLFEMMQQWNAMWMSAMKNFAIDDCTQMARDMMQLMRSLAPGSPAKFVLLPAHLMALVDPYAEWFTLWIRHAVSPGDALNNLLSTGLFFDLIQRCHDQGCVQWEEQPDMDVSGETIIILQGKNVQVRQLEHALFVQSLCMVRSILVSTRVALFPWTKVQSDTPTQLPYTCLLETSPMADEMDAPAVCDDYAVNEVLTVLDYFVRPIRNPASQAQLTTICCEAVETILWGLRSDKCMREVLQLIADSGDMMTGRIEARRNMFLLLVRVYHGTDWTKKKDTQEKLVEFLKLLRQNCMIGSDDPGFVEFEAILQEFAR